MRFPTMCYVRPAKPLVKLLTELQFAVSELKRRPQRLVRVYTCQTVKLLEISCGGSISMTIMCVGPFLDLQDPSLTVTQTVASVGDGTQATLDIADVI